MELYVRMCREAQKDLQRREPGLNDVVAYRYVFDGYEREGVRYFFHLAEDWQVKEESKRTYIFIVWRQDQLQEMLLDYDDPLNRFMTSVCYSTLVCNFAWFCGAWDEDAEGRSNVYIRKESLEVLWLAFVMAEKYSKEWNGSKWVKSNDIDMGRSHIDAAWNKILKKVN